MSPLDQLDAAHSQEGRRRSSRAATVPRPALEVADIFRDHGPAWRRAIPRPPQPRPVEGDERDRGLPHGGPRRPRCALREPGVRPHRHRLQQLSQSALPEVPGQPGREWLEARKAELLEVPYFHVVFTLPPRIGAIAYQNKAVIYDLLFKASAETLLTIAADPKRLGVKIGFTSVLHTWG